jgi:predicted HTH transcriptional regulator
MIPKQLEAITRDDVRRLIENSFPESRTIEYKREVPALNGGGDTVKLLKAVSGMANTECDDLIYGIDAVNGVPAGATGFPSATADQVKLKLEGWLQTCIEPRIAACRVSSPKSLKSVHSAAPRKRTSPN